MHIPFLKQIAHDLVQGLSAVPTAPVLLPENDADIGVAVLDKDVVGATDTGQLACALVVNVVSRDLLLGDAVLLELATLDNMTLGPAMGLPGLEAQVGHRFEVREHLAHRLVVLLTGRVEGQSGGLDRQLDVGGFCGHVRFFSWRLLFVIGHSALGWA